MGHPPPERGAGHGRPPAAAPAERTAAVIALTVSILSVLFCLLVINIVGVVLAGIALGSSDDPAKMRRYTRYSWISTAVCFVLAVLGFLGFFLFLDHIEFGYGTG